METIKNPHLVQPHPSPGCKGSFPLSRVIAAAAKLTVASAELVLGFTLDLLVSYGIKVLLPTENTQYLSDS